VVSLNRNQTIILPAFAIPAAGTGHASFFINNAVFLRALWAAMAGLCAIRYKLFKPADHTVFPGGDTVVVETQVVNQLNHIRQWHSMAQNTRN